MLGGIERPVFGLLVVTGSTTTLPIKSSGISLVTLNIFSSKKQKWIPSTIKRPHFLIALLSWKKNWNGFYSSYSSKDAFVLLTEGHVVLKIHFNGKASYCLPPRVDVFWLLLIKLQGWCVPIQGRAGWTHVMERVEATLVRFWNRWT